MENIYTLSYDISQLENQEFDNAARNEAYDSFMDYVLHHIISIDETFSIAPQPQSCKYDTHWILRPVESTIIFHSKLDIETIARQIKEQYKGKAYQIFYIINEIARGKIIGYSHINPELQNEIDEKMNIEYYSIKAEAQYREFATLIDQLEYISSNSTTPEEE